MVTPASALARRDRIGWYLVAFVAAALLLAGCSSSGDSGDTEPAMAEQRAEDGAYAEGDADGGGELAAAPGEVASDRSVIVTGVVYMTVDNPIAAADQAAGIVRAAGGRIDARSETAPDEGFGGSAWLTLRIPADDLDEVVDDLRGLGTVDEFSTESYDVTTEVTDLEAQISTLRASTERIEALLLEAEDISDIITLENELDGRQAQLESLEARQRGLNDQVSMSTIDLSLTTEPVVIVDDAPDNFWDGLVAGWGALVTFVSGALVVVGVLLPWIALLALIAVVIVVAVRSSTSRARRKRAAAQHTPAVEPEARPQADAESTTGRDA